MKARYAKQIRFGIEAAKVYLNEGYTDKERASMWYAAISARDLTWKAFQHTVKKRGCNVKLRTPRLYRQSSD